MKKIKLISDNNKVKINETKNYLNNRITSFGVDINFGLKKADIAVLLLTALILPFIYSLLYYILRVSSVLSSYTIAWQIHNYGFRIAIPCVGMFYGLILFWKKMVTYKILGIYLVGPVWYSFGLFISNVVGLTGSLLNNILYNLIVNLLFSLVVAIFYLYKNKAFWEMVKRSFNNLDFLSVAILVGVVCHTLLSVILNVIQEQVNVGGSSTSANQTGLVSWSSTVGGIIILFLFSVVIAPITEEFSYRYLILEITNKKWYGWVVGLIYFAYIHVRNANDFNHIFVYFSLGIVSGLIYKYTKNLTPCILIHFLSNLVSTLYNL